MAEALTAIDRAHDAAQRILNVKRVGTAPSAVPHTSDDIDDIVTAVLDSNALRVVEVVV